MMLQWNRNLRNINDECNFSFGFGTWTVLSLQLNFSNCFHYKHFKCDFSLIQSPLAITFFLHIQSGFHNFFANTNNTFHTHFDFHIDFSSLFLLLNHTPNNLYHILILNLLKSIICWLFDFTYSFFFRHVFLLIFFFNTKKNLITPNELNRKTSIASTHIWVTSSRFSHVVKMGAFNDSQSRSVD